MNRNRFSRLNQYRIMWVLVSFDLPTDTPRARKAATTFRNYLLKDGFGMFQYSIYTRCCPSRENAQVHINRIKKSLPKEGHVAIFQITDKQFGMIELYNGKKTVQPEKPSQQLEIF